MQQHLSEVHFDNYSDEIGRFDKLGFSTSMKQVATLKSLLLASGLYDSNLNLEDLEALGSRFTCLEWETPEFGTASEFVSTLEFLYSALEYSHCS